MNQTHKIVTHMTHELRLKEVWIEPKPRMKIKISIKYNYGPFLAVKTNMKETHEMILIKKNENKIR